MKEEKVETDDLKLSPWSRWATRKRTTTTGWRWRPWRSSHLSAAVQPAAGLACAAWSWSEALYLSVLCRWAPDSLRYLG